MKTCHFCLKTQPYDNFYSNITCKDGFNNLCRKCCNIYAKYRKEKLKEHNAKGLKTLDQKKPRTLRQKFFYAPRNPLPFNPEHAITVIRDNIQVEFK